MADEQTQASGSATRSHRSHTSSAMKYRMIGIDLDGTLLRPDQTISAEDRAAIRAAQQAGVYVVPCTGRAWHESRGPLGSLPGLREGVFVTGALIHDVPTGRTLDAALFDPTLAHQLIERLSALPEAVLVFRVPDRAGHDYLVTGHGDLTDNTRWWFAVTNARLHTDRDWSVEKLEHVVRVAVVSHQPSMQSLLRQVKQAFDGQIEVHCFGGVERTDGQLAVQILEVFPRGVNKWRGLRQLAQRHGIEDAQVAVIGDEINDLPAMYHAGLAVAMGNAVPPVLEAAHRITRSNTQAGVAHAIGQMLAGQW